MRVLIIKSLCALFLGAGFMLAMSLTVYRKSYYFKRAEAKMRGEAEKPGLEAVL
jgi:hypothetical protein